MNAAPERAVQITLKRWLEQVLPGCEVVAIKNEAQPRSTDPMARARFHQARKATGLRVGAPDLMVLTHCGGAFFVEVKAPKGRLSDNQLELHARWRNMGHTVIVADSIEALRLGLHENSIRTTEAAGQPMAPARLRGRIAC